MTKQIVHLEVRLKTKCLSCNGAGYLVCEADRNYEYICQDCYGAGYVWKNKIIDIETLKEMLNEQEN